MPSDLGHDITHGDTRREASREQERRRGFSEGRSFLRVGERIGAHIMTMYLLALLPVLGFLPAPINRADTSPLPKAPRINAHAPVSMLTLADEVDEAAMLAASTFPIKPDALIDRCKTVILEQMKIQDGSIDENVRTIPTIHWQECIRADTGKYVQPSAGRFTPTTSASVHRLLAVPLQRNPVTPCRACRSRNI